jgi:hypothetical protein
VVAVNVDWQAGQRGDDEERSKEKQPLLPAATEDPAHASLKTGNGAGSQQQPENYEAPERPDNIQNIADAADGNGLDEFVRRQSVGLLRVCGRGN